MTLGMTVVCAQSLPNFSTSFFRFSVAASRMAYTAQTTHRTALHYIATCNVSINYVHIKSKYSDGPK